MLAGELESCPGEEGMNPLPMPLPVGDDMMLENEERLFEKWVGVDGCDGNPDPGERKR